MATIDIRERQFDYGPQRAAWVFTVGSAKVLEAAQRRLDYHRARLAHWRAELDKAVDAVKDSTEVRQHQVTGGVQVTATIDQEKGQYMATCQAKVAAHRASVYEFSEWVELLGIDASGSYLMTIEDSKYFRLFDQHLADEFDE
jgi:hypothetical protein